MSAGAFPTLSFVLCTVALCSHEFLGGREESRRTFLVIICLSRKVKTTRHEYHDLSAKSVFWQLAQKIEFREEIGRVLTPFPFFAKF